MEKFVNVNVYKNNKVVYMAEQRNVYNFVYM